MNKKLILLIIITTFFMITTGYYKLQYDRYKEHSRYHRSRMFEYELMVNLYKLFPVGTPLDNFLSRLGLDRTAAFKYPYTKGMLVDIKPELPIPKSEQRDYSGFFVSFENNRLKKITPSGPKPTRHAIKWSDLEIGKEIYYIQKP